MTDKEYIDQYMKETEQISVSLDRNSLQKAIEVVRKVRDRQGRLFILGVGGSAGNASHAVNDFRKIAGIEAYAPTDNVAELTAWTNDKSWDAVFEEWLKESRLGTGDGLLIFSVGGGSPTTSQNLVKAMVLAKTKGAAIVSVVSRDGGHAAKVSDACVLIPAVADERITAHSEGWQGIVWHLIVNALTRPEV
jgi:D-sedoheptulose 7-phosphate isomerase